MHKHLPGSPAKPPNQLLSRRSDSKGVFDFDGVLDSEDDVVVEGGFHSDIDSFYSDIEFHHDDTGNSIHSNAHSDAHDSDSDLDNDSNEDSDSDSDAYPDENDDDHLDASSNDDRDDSDMSDATYIQSDSSGRIVDNNDCFSYDFEEDELSDVEYLLPNYTPRPFPDERVPISDNIYWNTTKNLRAEYITQLQSSQLFNQNKASIKMHDELIDIINAYIESLHVPPLKKLLHRKQFMEKMEKKYNTSDLKPRYGSVRFTNNALVTMPVFNMKAMILSILHDNKLMREENFATGLDIFTDSVPMILWQNCLYVEEHASDQ